MTWAKSAVGLVGAVVIVLIGLLGIQTQTMVPPEASVLYDTGSRTYATAQCVAENRVSGSFIENPQDASDPDRKLLLLPSVEMITLGEASERVKAARAQDLYAGPDAKCRDSEGFIWRKESLFSSLFRDVMGQ